MFRRNGRTALRCLGDGATGRSGVAGGSGTSLRISFLECHIFEIWFLISRSSICQVPAFTPRRGTGQNGITEK
jgi:hypothetical protein